MAHLDDLDAWHSAACTEQRAAQARFTRSRSAKNRAALIAAENAVYEAAAACRAERERIEAAERTADRAARRAAIAAERARQGDFFAALVA